MFFGFNLLSSHDLFNDALFVDDEGGADGAHDLLAVHGLLSPGSHGLQQGVVYIGNQGKGQLIFLFEFLM